MNLDEDSSLSVSCGNGKLRQWLIDQIDSRRYPGLIWENTEKSIFRIPWKHAGKQDYNREEDAALFKAWAMFKGKYKEGVDKPDPPTWKTRLRCALNKSNDFDELVERSQLDISEPYKVYRIIPEEAKKGMKTSSVEDTQSHVNSLSYIPPYTSMHNQVSRFSWLLRIPGYILPQERRDWRDYSPPEQQPLLPSHHHTEVQYGQCHYPPPFSRPWPGSHAENGKIQQHIHVRECDFSLHVSLYYRESLVKEVTTASPDGCQITTSSSSSPSSSSSSSPCPEDKFHGRAEVIVFPFPYPESHRQCAELLPNVLERGVLLWMTLDGLYAKRLCQGRVYWEGPMAPYVDKPNKLEKEQPCKLFDTQQFLMELQDFAHNGRQLPRHQVVLCFGDEYPDPQRPRKMITAQVEPVFARKLVYYYQQNNSQYLRVYDHIQEQSTPPTHIQE
uniref:IRF tryptophan pentad repeat domain-containing protein n=1 Tax=Mola mola TaxID=94237 RepID=A0A3Q4BS01_MOLML